jgi:superfamily II RNA helicase
VRRETEDDGTARAILPLVERIPASGTRDVDEIFDRFIEWVKDTGLELYSHQEDALMEVMADRHLVLCTPTGSGKSLVAMAVHFKALCEGEKSFYTCPVKALASEKFFDFCDVFGAENVGMLTGDASINPDAPIICCTTEVLANMALRQGATTPIRYAVLDEFHYYADRDRGVAWQIPLLLLPQTTFLLMSATLGNTAFIEERLRAQTGREVSNVYSEIRPVPLDFEYRETALHETIDTLLDRSQYPIYVVHFTQRQCAEQAQALTSAKVSSRAERKLIDEALGSFRFDSTYGKDVKRFLRNGVGIHHAGLLPKYRLLVEQLAQKGLLKVICGTDTLGVGVNIPIRTVLFTQLSKFDGEKVGVLRVREFKQIAGRAGRKGFDEQGSVVCQAPEHVIENKRAAERSAQSGRKRKPAKKKAPSGMVAWNRDTFQRLTHQPPETLESQFKIDHHTLVSVLQREPTPDGSATGYRALIELIDRSHERPVSKSWLRRHAAVLARSLQMGGIIEVRAGDDGRPTLQLATDLQFDFSLHHTLSLFLVDAITVLDPDSPAYAIEVLTLVESILEDPRAILYAQIRKLKRELMLKLKAQRVPYEERIAKLDTVTHPRPDADFVYAAFGLFTTTHPWVGDENIHLKSIAREMFEELWTFDDYTKEYAIARSEGLLLRYLSQVLNTLVKTVPESFKTDELYDLMAYFRAMLSRVDSSLIDAWETLVSPTDAEAGPQEARQPEFDLAAEPRLLAARVRSELHELVRELSVGQFERAASCCLQDPDDRWDGERFEQALAPFFAEYERLLFTPVARQSHKTTLRSTGPRTWQVFQSLVDPEGDGLWAIEGVVDLSKQRNPEGRLVRVRRVGP